MKEKASHSGELRESETIHADSTAQAEHTAISIELLRVSVVASRPSRSNHIHMRHEARDRPAHESRKAKSFWPNL